MSADLTGDFFPIDDLRREPETLLMRTRESGRPLVNTVDGRAEDVLVDAKSYQLLFQALKMARILHPAEEVFEKGRLKPATTFFSEFWHERKHQKEAGPV